MPVVGWAPGTVKVAAHLRNYTKTSTGAQLGDFDTTTTITSLDAVAAIASVVDDVSAYVGDVPPLLQNHAASVVALGAAAEAVIDLDPSLSAQMQQLYDDRLGRLKVAVDDARDGSIDGRPVGTQPASGFFPGPFAVGIDRF